MKYFIDSPTDDHLELIDADTPLEAMGICMERYSGPAWRVYGAWEMGKDIWYKDNLLMVHTE